jgi:hypothetical protein
MWCCDQFNKDYIPYQYHRLGSTCDVLRLSTVQIFMKSVYKKAWLPRATSNGPQLLEKPAYNILSQATIRPFLTEKIKEISIYSSIALNWNIA